MCVCVCACVFTCSKSVERKRERQEQPEWRPEVVQRLAAVGASGGTRAADPRGAAANCKSRGLSVFVQAA